MGSDFLFVRPSLIQGLGSVVDLAGVAEEGNYNLSKSTEEADYRALAADWLVVGADLFESYRALTRHLK